MCGPCFRILDGAQTQRAHRFARHGRKRVAVIFEYKRAVNENVINQGLFYLDWLLDHRAEFKLVVLERLGADIAAELDWATPRLICVANGFTRYDEHAVQQINRSVELYRYKDYQGDLLALELVSAVTAPPFGEEGPGVAAGPAKRPARRRKPLASISIRRRTR